MDAPNQLAGQMESGQIVHFGEKQLMTSPTMSTTTTLTPSFDGPKYGV